MRFWKRQAAKRHAQATPIEIVKRSPDITAGCPGKIHPGRSSLWRYSDGTLRCHCGYACLATYEACAFEECRRWPTWPNGCPS